MANHKFERVAATILILAPFPFYLNAKAAGTWMKWRFADSIAMRYAATDQRDRWEYYVGFIAQASGFWLPVGYNADSKYQWESSHTGGDRATGAETLSWQERRPTLIGRFSLWTAFWKMRRLDRSFRPRKRKYHRSLKDMLHLLVAQAKAAIIVPPAPKPWVPMVFTVAPPSEETLERVRQAFADAPEVDFEMPVGFPDVNLELKPKTYRYNWKTIQPRDQAAYRKAGWRPVPPKRHPELAELVVGARIIWGGMVLMQCSAAAYGRMQRDDFVRATQQFDEPAMRKLGFKIVDELNIKADDENDPTP